MQLFSSLLRAPHAVCFVAFFLFWDRSLRTGLRWQGLFWTRRQIEVYKVEGTRLCKRCPGDFMRAVGFSISLAIGLFIKIYNSLSGIAENVCNKQQE